MAGFAITPTADQVNPVLSIDLEGKKRSWAKIKKILDSNPQTKIDWRKGGKEKIRIDCTCGTVLIVWHVKDFPLNDVICKCSKYLIKWS